MPDEKTQGGYATIFHNHLNHQVKKLTMTHRIDASQPKGMSVKSLDQQAGRKPRPKSAQIEQQWVDKTYKTIADMSVRTQSKWIRGCRLCPSFHLHQCTADMLVV
jgi:hypothetical protein